jgi:hypothetical protein
MKKQHIFFCASLLLCATWALGQQVGVGTNSPTERLDVNGNVNVRGQLKINGQGGQPGQVLQMGANGLQQWTSAFGYKNRKDFYTNSTFTVPAGVTEIMLIGVGGGGGGAKGGGGASGSMCLVRVKVVAGNVFNIQPALRVLGAATENESGADGSNTQVSGPAGFVMVASGGLGATHSHPGDSFWGGVAGDSIFYAESQLGQYGEVTKETYMQRLANEFVTVRQYGNGGASLLPPYAVQQGTYFSFNSATLSNLRLVYGSFSRQTYDGSGGAGGNTLDGRWGGLGEAGRVIVLW